MTACNCNQHTADAQELALPEKTAPMGGGLSLVIVVPKIAGQRACPCDACYMCLKRQVAPCVSRCPKYCNICFALSGGSITLMIFIETKLKGRLTVQVSAAKILLKCLM